MQIKNKKMEFTSKQNDQLKNIKDMNRLQQLQTKCENLNAELETLSTEWAESLKEREMLMERLKTLQGEIKTARENESSWKRKLEEANKILVDDKNEHLHSICLLLGYKISNCQLLENNGLQITLCYRDSCHVTYSETSQVFDLIEIYPQHFNFLQIKEFLQTSQDLRGLLSCLRKFFDFALDYKDKQE